MPKPKTIRNGRKAGYENHSGLTTLGPGAWPFGTVTSGDGNNGRDRTEGARVHHVIGTYLHGSLLPKNPRVAVLRSEERRVGQECRSRWSPYH